MWMHLQFCMRYIFLLINPINNLHRNKSVGTHQSLHDVEAMERTAMEQKVCISMLMLNPAVRLQSFPSSTQYSRTKAYNLPPFAPICCTGFKMPLNECD